MVSMIALTRQPHGSGRNVGGLTRPFGAVVSDSPPDRVLPSGNRERRPPMPRHSDDDEWAADDADWDPEDESPSSDDDDESTIACPSCREQIHEDAPQCPDCGHYVSDA